MGRKRKVIDQNTALGYEDETTGPSSVAKPDLEKLNEDSQAMEAMIVQSQVPNGAKSETSSREGTTPVRRSIRLNSLTSTTKTLEVKPLVEHVNLVEQEPEADQDNIPAQMNEQSLKEKVDSFVRAAADEYFKSKVLTGDDEVLLPGMSYKSLYFDSQKKIEALMEDHYRLVRKLEFANGKIAAYEGMKEDFVLLSGLRKGAEVAVTLSPKRVQKDAAPIPPVAPTKILKKQVRFAKCSSPKASCKKQAE